MTRSRNRLFASLMALLLCSNAAGSSFLRGAVDTETQSTQQQAQAQLQERSLVDDSIAEQYEPTSRKESVLTVHAADFRLPDSVVLDEEAGNLSHLSKGDILGVPSLRVPQSGLYRIEARISNPNAVGQVWIYNPSTTQVLSQIDYLPWTKNWNSWATVRLGLVRLTGSTDSSDSDTDTSATDNQLHLLIQQGGFNLQHLTLTRLEPRMAAYFGPSTPATPTFVLPASSYVHASDSVLIEQGSQQQQQTAAAAVPNVGGIGAGATLDYDLTSATSFVPPGTYRLRLAVSSPTTDGRILVVHRNNRRILSELPTVPNTGGWHTWDTVEVPDELVLASDVQQAANQIQLIALRGGFNFLFLLLEQVSEETTMTPARTSDEVQSVALASSPVSPPNNNDDNDESSSYFFWAAETLEASGVTVEHSSEGGPGNLGSLDDGDSVSYVLDVARAGRYTISMRIASGWIRGAIPYIEHGGAVDFFLDNSNHVGDCEGMPSSGGWQVWTTVTGSVDLPAGSSVLEMRVRQGGFNLLWFQLDYSNPLE